MPTKSMNKKEKSMREAISLSERKFNPLHLPKDMYRVYSHLHEKYNEKYALTFVFMMRTALELHRAWHMTLLTSKILQQIKEKFDMKMTWELGVVKLKFRVEDGGYELHRKVPYDYDSEYQDIYMRIATSLIDDEITIHEALIYQDETLSGVHTANSGKLLRDFPGRLILYPLEASTCAVIFFNGDWYDALIAAVCGFVAGIIEWCMGMLGGEIKILTDISVGVSTGIITGLWYTYIENSNSDGGDGDGVCIQAIFLGTLYWFFYGTAFVIGLLEIIAGELETGVTRFMAVSIKTFILSLGASLGLMIATNSRASDAWVTSMNDNCSDLIIVDMWYRIPLYLLCSASALGQYRYPVIQYWRGLIVQLCAYEVQFQTDQYLGTFFQTDNLDTSASNLLGAAAGVLSACTLSHILNVIRTFYSKRLLQTNKDKNTNIGNFMFKLMKCSVRIGSCLRLGRDSDFEKLKLKKKFINRKSHNMNVVDSAHVDADADADDSAHADGTAHLGGAPNTDTNILHTTSSTRSDTLNLTPTEENLVLETIVGSQEINLWSMLMPAVYQLVPGSAIAKIWFGSIFPNEQETDTVFATLMVTSASLAIGLIIGFVSVQVLGSIFSRVLCLGKTQEQIERTLNRLAGMHSVPKTGDDDPETNADNNIEVAVKFHGARKHDGDDGVGNIDDGDNNIDGGNIGGKPYFPVSLEETTAGRNDTPDDNGV